MNIRAAVGYRYINKVIDHRCEIRDEIFYFIFYTEAFAPVLIYLIAVLSTISRNSPFVDCIGSILTYRYFLQGISIRKGQAGFTFTNLCDDYLQNETIRVYELNVKQVHIIITVDRNFFWF